MDEEIERLLVSVRADTGAFSRDVAEMRAQLAGPLSEGAARAGLTIEAALLRAVRTGKFGFEDLKRTILTMMNEIASSALRSGVNALAGGGGGGGGSGGGLGGLAGQLITSLLGLPGRAGGGPVAPGRAYVVGERGPELFVPTASGRIDAGSGQTAPRDIRMSITVNAPSGGAPEALAKSSRQVARAVREALLRVED
ncbi:MAG TPA: tail tape measure protein [Allosphingosinicella sp.]